MWTWSLEPHGLLVRTVPHPPVPREAGPGVCPEKRTGFGGLVASLDTGYPILYHHCPSLSRLLLFRPFRPWTFGPPASSCSESQCFVASSSTGQGPQKVQSGRVSTQSVFIFCESTEPRHRARKCRCLGMGTRALPTLFSLAHLPRHGSTSSAKHRLRGPQLESGG